MSSKRTVVLAAVIASAALSAAPAQAGEFHVELTPEEIQRCIETLETRNPDVLQGWIDSCRRAKAEEKGSRR